MERHLCGADHIQAVKGIHIGIGAKGFHHRLCIGFCMILTFQNNIAFRKRLIDITNDAFIMRMQIAQSFIPDFTQQLIVLFRMNDNRMVECLCEIQHSIIYFILNTNQLHRLQRTRFILCDNDGNLITDIPYNLIQYQTIIWGWLGIGLPCQRES